MQPSASQVTPQQERRPDGRAEERCIRCGATLTGAPLYAAWRVCPQCRYHYSIPARQRIERLVDPGSFREMSRRVAAIDPIDFRGQPYRERYFEEQRRSGLREAVITGGAALYGRRVVIAVVDFRFFAGTLGVAVGEKLAHGMEEAARQHAPLIAFVASSGPRLQEGVLSVLQMAKLTTARQRMRQARAPLVAVAVSPCTGSLYASLYSEADVCYAEPGALLGYAAMRAMEQAEGASLPENAHTAEWHLAHGLIDAVLDRERHRDALATFVELAGSPYRVTLTGPRQEPVRRQAVPEEAWGTVRLAREHTRPTAVDYIKRVTTAFVEFRGDRQSGDEPAVVAGLASLGGQPLMFVAQQRLAGEDGQHRPSPIGASGFRKAARAIRIASDLQLPVVTLVDSSGPDPRVAPEASGLGSAMALCLETLLAARTPTIACIIGEGGSEAAVAFAAADRVLMLENAIWDVIAPEEAAALLYRDPSRAGAAASSLRLTGSECRRLGVVDRIVSEPPGGAHQDVDAAARQLRGALLLALTELQGTPTRRLLDERQERYRQVGEATNPIRSSLERNWMRLRRWLRSLGLRVRRGRTAEDQEMPIP